VRIAILGSGNVGGNLGAALVAAGHQVVYGVRDPDGPRARAALAGAPGSTATSLQTAVDGAQVVALAIHWDVLPEVLERIRVPAGTVVLDATNRLIPARPGSAPSGGEEVARLLPGTHVVKACNTIGAENLPTLRQRATRAAGFHCGDDDAAKALVAGLLDDIGFEPFDVGPLAMSAVLEGMTRVWVTIARDTGRHISFSTARS
jgi:8-hydroxy-5-deazaflavin:NADPH oxidoreductase